MLTRATWAKFWLSVALAAIIHRPMTGTTFALFALPAGLSED